MLTASLGALLFLVSPNMAHLRQSRPGSGLDVQANGIKAFYVVPSSLECGVYVFYVMP